MACIVPNDVRMENNVVREKEDDKRHVLGVDIDRKAEGRVDTTFLIKNRRTILRLNERHRVGEKDIVLVQKEENV